MCSVCTTREYDDALLVKNGFRLTQEAGMWVSMFLNFVVVMRALEFIIQGVLGSKMLSENGILVAGHVE